MWSEQLVNSTEESVGKPSVKVEEGKLDRTMWLRLWIIGGGEWWVQVQDKDLETRLEQVNALGWQAMQSCRRRRRGKKI